MKQYIFLVLMAITLMACGEDPEIVDQPSIGTTIDAEVGGETQPNRVFVDLSEENQTVVNRNDWDLAFSTSQNRVLLNNAVGMLAYKLDATDLTSVTADDTVGFSAQLSLDAIFASLFLPQAPAWLIEAKNWADSPDGDLSKTAIAEVSETDSDNSVYIINRGTSPAGEERGWLKIKVTRSGDTYTVTYGDIAGTTFSSVSVSKDQDYDFNYLSFETGELVVEPEQGDWDIAFTTYIDLLNFGVEFPYGVKDWVIQSPSTQTSEVIIDQNDDIVERFDAFTLADAEALTYETVANNIAGNWRTVASPTPGTVTATKGDRFYIIQDSDGNYYKLVFTAMLNLSGERGYPQFSYELLK